MDRPAHPIQDFALNHAPTEAAAVGGGGTLALAARSAARGSARNFANSAIADGALAEPLLGATPTFVERMALATGEELGATAVGELAGIGAGARLGSRYGPAGAVAGGALAAGTTAAVLANSYLPKDNPYSKADYLRGVPSDSLNLLNAWATGRY
jgi:hypothetical protein